MALPSRYYTVMGAVVVLWAAAYVSRASSSSTPRASAPAVDCSSLVLTMADCLSFVSNGSTVDKPEGTCCSGLKTVLKTDAVCLCEAFRSSAQLGVVLNITKALALPSACKVSSASASNCGLSIAPTSSPVLSPETSPSSETGAATPSTPREASASDKVSAPAVTPSPSPSLGTSGSSKFMASAVLLLSSAAVAVRFW